MVRVRIVHVDLAKLGHPVMQDLPLHGDISLEANLGPGQHAHGDAVVAFTAKAS